MGIDLELLGSEGYNFKIKNRSAYEAASITKETFDWLIEVLFKQGELLKIWELAEKGSC